PRPARAELADREARRPGPRRARPDRAPPPSARRRRPRRAAAADAGRGGSARPPAADRAARRPRRALTTFTVKAGPDTIALVERARVVVNADDFGLCAAVNRAIGRAHEEGVLTSASLLANGPTFDEAVAIARARPSLGVGVHLNLLRGRPLARVPSLV